MGSARRAQPSCGLGERLELRLEAKPGELSDQPPDFGLRRAAIEIVGAKIVMRHAVFQHVVDGREDEGGDSAYGLLPPAPALQPLELGHVVAVLLAFGRPGTLYHALDPAIDLLIDLLDRRIQRTPLCEVELQREAV